MKGMSVVVHRPIEGEADGFGARLKAFEDEQVNGVLVAPGRISEGSENVRPENVEITYTLHFPKSYEKNLDGCYITVRGERLRVVGSPRPLMKENTPTRWNMVVEVYGEQG